MNVKSILLALLIGISLPCSGQDFQEIVLHQVDSSDLLSFLSGIGCQEDCFYDLTGDDIVNSSDMLSFLSFFGVNCD